MAESQGKNRRVAWFENSVHPALQKASVAEQMFPFQKPRGLHLGVMYKQDALQANGNTPGYLDIGNDESAPGDNYSQGFHERTAHYMPNVSHSDPAQRSSQGFDDPRGRMLIARGPRHALQNSASAMDALRDTGVVPKMHGYDLRDTRDQHLVTESLGHAGYAPMTYPDDSDEETPGLRSLHPDARKHLGNIDPMQLARSAYGSLSKIHDAGYVHGNVGPESLWMNKDGHVKFTHLGDARKGADDTVRQNDIFGMLKAINDHHPSADDHGFHEKINNHIDENPEDWHSPEKMKVFLGMGGPKRQRLGPPAAPAAPAAPSTTTRQNFSQAVAPAPATTTRQNFSQNPYTVKSMNAKKGAMSWFENSVHPALRKEEFEKGILDSVRSLVSGAPKPASVTAPKPASVTASTPANVTASTPAASTVPKPAAPFGWLAGPETPTPRPRTYSSGTGEPSFNFKHATYRSRQGPEFANDAVNTDMPAWSTPVETPSDRHKASETERIAREKAESDKRTAWQVAYNKQMGFSTPEEIAAQKAEKARAAAARAAVPVVPRNVARPVLGDSVERQERLKDKGSHQAGLELLEDVRDEFAPDKLGSLTAPQQWAASLGTKRGDEDEDLKKAVLAMHDRLALMHRYSGVDGEIDGDELGSLFGIARKGGMLPDGSSSASGYEPTTRTPTAWQSGTGEIIHHGSPRSFVGSQVDPARIGSGSDAGFGLYGVSRSLNRPANQYAHQGNGRTAQGNTGGEATTPTVHSYEIPKDMKVARIDRPLKLDDDQLGRICAYLNDVAKLHLGKEQEDDDGNPIPRFSVAGLRAMQFPDDAGGKLTFDQKNHVNLPGRFVLDGLVKRAIGVGDGAHSSHVSDNVLSNMLQVAGFDATRANNSDDKGGDVLAIHAGGIHKLIHRQSEVAADDTHEQQSKSEGPFLRRPRDGITPEIQFPETHALMERAKLARGDWDPINANALVEKHLEDSFPKLGISGLQNSPHGENSVIKHTKDGLAAMNTGEGNPALGRLEGALYGMSNPDDRRIARIAYLFHDVGKSSDSEDPEAQKAAARASDGAGPGEHHQDKSWDLLMAHPDKPLEQFGLSDEETGLVQKLISQHHAFGDVVKAATLARRSPENPRLQAALAQAKEQFGEIAGNKRTARLLSSMWQADVQGIPAYREAPSRLLGGFGEGATFGETRRQLLKEMYVDHEGDHHPEKWQDDVVNASAAVKSFTRRRKGMLMKSGKDRITAQVRKEEERQRKKIHKEEQAEMRGVEHEEDHGISAHEDKVMKLIARMGKAIRSPGSPYSKPTSRQQNRATFGWEGQGSRHKTGFDSPRYQPADMATGPKIASLTDVDPFTKSQKEVLDRMDRWKKKTEEKLLEEEDKLVDRIHSDHTGPGVPKFVGKYTHGAKQHEQRLKRVIDKLRDDEEAEVREEMDDQESKCSRCGKDPCVCGKVRKSELSKKKLQKVDLSTAVGAVQDVADNYDTLRQVKHGANHLANMVDGKLNQVQQNNAFTNWGINVAHHPGRGAQRPQAELPGGFNALRGVTTTVQNVTKPGSISGRARRIANTVANKVVSTITGKRP